MKLFSPPLFAHEEGGGGRRDIPPRRNRYGKNIEGSQFIFLHLLYVCSCIYVHLYVYILFVMYVSFSPLLSLSSFLSPSFWYVCGMLLSVYDTFTIITICSSSTIHLNPRIYISLYLYIYIIRKKINRALSHH